MTMMVPDKYYRAIKNAPPKAIHNKKEHIFYLSKIESLMLKDRSPEEEDLLETLIQLVHVYEQEKFPMKAVDPAEALAFLMEENNLKPADLPLPPSRVSEILNHKRSISKAQAFLLANRFKVSPTIFFAE